MENTLERIVDRVYQEGISRAQDRAAAITAAAEAQAAEITRKAKDEAAQITAAAKDEALRLLRSADSDLKLTASRALGSLRNEISQLLAAQAVASPLSAALSDVQFIKDLFLKLAENRDGTGLMLSVPQGQRDELVRGLSGLMQGRLKGLEILAGSMKAGFVVRERDAGFELDFTEPALLEFLQPHIKPAIASLFRSQNG
ncbi:hypothetical protein [Turneriella parva]|uniref:H+transporting two-sector ATPase E subunit n=1 Tax=Turneriella parva (strain ATCC BAA-1111 / DSM 21527 / NCTC 11395 / H) TaxID=869212 RepID=I4BA61_TURPD|nr:hypothetical protein [Turneriella parva]AFM14168.1 hypothetical protein Turpa_3532 [Turneriella parva DSM 21527]